MALVVLYGVAGTGKTTIAQAVAADEPDVQVAFFDLLGVPDADEMVRDHGSAEGWERAATAEWMRRLAPAVGGGVPVLLEGRMRRSLVEEAAAAVNLAGCAAVLVDCEDEVLRERLQGLGRDPASVDEALRRAEELRTDAAEYNVRVIDTSMRGVTACADEVIRLLRRP